MVKKRKAYKFFVGNPEGRTSSRWEVNIKVDVRETGTAGVVYI
jgi:hypothetical protein